MSGKIGLMEKIIEYGYRALQGTVKNKEEHNINKIKNDDFKVELIKLNY